jgi:hypothetical protein
VTADVNQDRNMRIEIELVRVYAHARETIDMYPVLMRCRRNPRMKIKVRAGNTTYRGAKQAVAVYQVHGTTNTAMLSECHRVIKFKRFFKMCTRKPPRDAPYDQTRWYNFFGREVEGLDVQFQVNNDGFVIHVKRKYTDGKRYRRNRPWSSMDAARA